ncbi:MAG: archaeosortase/exosortase family protein [Acidobacteriia bacterium]|nr:archaeosortase/exosortase family protein [Terriglobia bacterium]
MACFSFHSDIYPYTGVIPLLSAGFIYLERKRIFCNVEYGSGSGGALILPALALVRWSKKQSGWLSPNESLSLITLSIVALWMGLFVLCGGVEAFQAATFQMLLLPWMVARPPFLLGRALRILRSGSAQAARVFCRWAGDPAFRVGLSVLTFLVASLRQSDRLAQKGCDG